MAAAMACSARVWPVGDEARVSLLEAITRSATMARGSVHTVPVDDGLWRNRVESMELLPGAYLTKADAVEAGSKEAKRRETEHVVHNRDGTIAARHSYGPELAHQLG